MHNYDISFYIRNSSYIHEKSILLLDFDFDLNDFGILILRIKHSNYHTKTIFFIIYYLFTSFIYFWFLNFVIFFYIFFYPLSFIFIQYIFKV